MEVPVAVWLAMLVAAALPFWLSVGAVIAHQRWERNERAASGGLEPAAPWLRGISARVAPGLRVDVDPEGGVDAYWPGVDAVGLSAATAGGRTAVHRAIAAHELGHAMNCRAHPWLAMALPGARVVEGLAWRGFGAALLVTALLGLGGAAGPAALFAAIAVLAGVVVVGDEVAASWRANGWLSADPALSAADRRSARRAMAHASSVYASRLVGQALVLAALPWLLPVAVGLRPVRQVAEVDAIGGWILFFALPFLALRLLQVIAQVVRPEPVGSDFRVFTLTLREAQWESVTGFAVLAVLLALHDHAVGPWFAASAAIAAIAALGPVAAVGRALVVLPAWMVLRGQGAATDRDAARLAEAGQDGGPTPLQALWSDPPWYLRAAWLANLAWLPMILLLTRALLSHGWWPA